MTAPTIQSLMTPDQFQATLVAHQAGTLLSQSSGSVPITLPATAASNFPALNLLQNAQISDQLAGTPVSVSTADVSSYAQTVGQSTGILSTSLSASAVTVHSAQTSSQNVQQDRQSQLAMSYDNQHDSYR